MAVLYGMVWYSIVLCRMVWYSMVRCGMVLYCMVLYGIVSYGKVRHGMVCKVIFLYVMKQVRAGWRFLYSSEREIIDPRAAPVIPSLEATD